jgi:4-hydroxybenzoate polyprenyltransferase
MDDYELIQPSKQNTLTGFLQLTRLPNVFTAMSNVAMGFLFVTAVTSPSDIAILVFLFAASSALYIGGVVMNDLGLDAEERPNRPLPSGRVTLHAARTLFVALFAFGIAAGWTVAFSIGRFLPGVIAIGLLICIVLYNAVLKRTPFGPIAMGGCRALNVLLGMSVSATVFSTANWLVVGGIGLYIVGVTWFARTEAMRSRRPSLAAAFLVMLAGIASLVWLPEFLPIGRLLPHYQNGLRDWYLLVGILTLMVSWRCVVAILSPDARWVQSAVGQAILSLMLFDAAICLACDHPYCAAALFLLMLPVRLLGRKISPT